MKVTRNMLHEDLQTSRVYSLLVANKYLMRNKLLCRVMEKLAGAALKSEPPETVNIEERYLPTTDGDTKIRVKIYRPKSVSGSEEKLPQQIVRPESNCSPNRSKTKMQQPLNFAGKRIVITGAYSGIGAALVDVLRQFGADHIAVLDIKEPEASVEKFIETDMGNPMSIDAAVATLTADGEPPIDVLFNNAGVAATLPSDTVMRINTLGLKRLTERLLPTMNTGGAIVNTASIAGNGWPGHLEQINALLAIDSWDEGVSWVAGNADAVGDGYAFSKECIQVYTMRTAKTATQHGLRINSVCPSPVDTPLLPAFRETMSDQAIDWAIEAGAGRVATAEDQARALVFLGSELSSYVNGVNLVVDGGLGAAMQTGQAALPQIG